MRKPCAHHWIIADAPDAEGMYAAHCRKCRRVTTFAGRLPANLWRHTYREKLVADPLDAVDCGEKDND